MHMSEDKKDWPRRPEASQKKIIFKKDWPGRPEASKKKSYVTGYS
jgi:hypothetical protein